jgi:hypothetical protein
MSNAAHLNMLLLLALGVFVWAGSHIYERVSARRSERSQAVGAASNQAPARSDPPIAKPLPRA